MEGREHMPHQEALPLSIRDQGSFDTFIKGACSSLIDTLVKSAQGGEHEFFFISGPRGCGKSHLLSAVSHEFDGAFCVDLELARAFSPEFIDISQPKIALIDNADAIAGNVEWELALFSLFNRWYDSKEGTLVISSTPSFDRIPFERHDLNTRLSSGICINLKLLNEQECIEALILRAKSRGFTLPDSAALFLVRHCNRDMNKLIAELDILDNAQLEEKRSITVPFIKKVFDL